jgi:hypothetical protein
MAGIHALIGLGEGAVSAMVYLAIARARPDILGDANGAAAGGSALREFVVLGVVASLGIALFVAPFASPWPDGLEAVAEHLGFAHRLGEAVLTAPAPGYRFPGLLSSGVSTAIAGALGTLVVFALAVLFSRLVVSAPASRRRPDSAP